MPRRIPAGPRRLVLAIAAALALVLVARWLSPAPPASLPWLLAPQASGALAWRNSPRALQLGACPPLCLEAGEAVWALSPNGRHLAWIDAGDKASTLHISDGPEGHGDFSLLLPEPAPLPGAKWPPAAPRVLWSPDGARLLAVPREGRPLVLDVSTRGVTWLRGPSSREITAVAWSPDGQRIAFVARSRDSGAGLSGAVYAVDAITGLPVAQAYAIAPADGVGWDGAGVVFAAYTSLDWRPRPVRPRLPRLWRLDSDTGTVRAGTMLPSGWDPVALATGRGGCGPAAATIVFIAARPAPDDVPGAPAVRPGAATDLWAYDPSRGGWRRLTHFKPGSAIASLATGPGGALAWVLRQPGAGAPFESVWWLAYPGEARRLSGPGRYGPPAWVIDLPPGLAETPGWWPKA